jgi:hypothetical protein
LMLCFMIAKMIGPTEMLNINPSTKPFISGATIVYMLRMNVSNASNCLPFKTLGNLCCPPNLP